MKIKKLWLPMIILGIIGGAAKICDTCFNVNGDGFFLDSDICSAVFILSLLLLFTIGFITLITDRKIDIEASPSKSKAAAGFGFIAAVAMVGSGVISLLSLGSSDSLAGSLFGCLLGLVGGIVMIYESCISFTGQNGMTKFPVASLILPLWCCGRLISLFIEYSKVSIHATEMFDVVSTTFLMLFLFYQAMFFAELNPKTAVRRTTLYGYCYFMCSMITTSDIIIKMFNPVDPETTGIDTLVVEPTVSRILTCIIDLAFCGYVIAFIASNAKNAVVTEYEEDEDLEEPEFLGSISTGDKKEPPAAKKTDRSRGQQTERPKKKKIYKGQLKFEDEAENNTDYDFTDLQNLMKEKNENSSVLNTDVPETVADFNLVPIDDSELERITSGTDNESQYDPMRYESFPETEPAPMTYESVAEAEPAPMTYESLAETEPAPMTYESVAESEPAPMTYESVTQPVSSPLTDKTSSAEESAVISSNTYVTQPSYEPQTVYEEETTVTDEVSDFIEEDPFASDKSDADYEEIFRMLDEMSEDS